MKQCLLAGLWLLSALYGRSQAVDVRRLKAELELHPQADTFRVNRLNQLAGFEEITPLWRDSLLREALGLSRNIAYSKGEAIALNGLSRYAEKEQALVLAGQALAIAETTGDKPLIAACQLRIGSYYELTGNLPKAMEWLFKAQHNAVQGNDLYAEAGVDGALGRAYLHTGRTDSALYYGARGYANALRARSLEFIRDNSEVLSLGYKMKKNYGKALEYYKIYIRSRDSLVNSQVNNQSDLMQYNHDLEKKQAEITVLSKDKQLQQEEVRRQRYLLIGTVIGLVLIIAILVVLYLNNRQRRKAYTLLQSQKQEIQQQRDQTNQALAELQRTQHQLVQSEKMASLGELTAGIAHEIQNPLNFVNNFSDLSVELLDELKDAPLKELTGTAKDDAEQLIADISQNMGKINYHGKRADTIVKGMLNHSRSNSQKEPTDINALAEEYLRLSYQGLRVKDNSFQAKMETSFDPSAGRISVIPQDIGRVLLNLLSNAFYSVSEKKKQAGEGYEPVVTLTTQKIVSNGAAYVKITVKDNGLGIPRKMLDKIYQPFFTTRPTGQGTGLGLSMSYDIITKSHDGELSVDTQEGEFAAFTITLPV